MQKLDGSFDFTDLAMISSLRRTGLWGRMRRFYEERGGDCNRIRWDLVLATILEVKPVATPIQHSKKPFDCTAVGRSVPEMGEERQMLFPYGGGNPIEISRPLQPSRVVKRTGPDQTKRVTFSTESSIDEQKPILKAIPPATSNSVPVASVVSKQRNEIVVLPSEDKDLSWATKDICPHCMEREDENQQRLKLHMSICPMNENRN